MPGPSSAHVAVAPGMTWDSRVETQKGVCGPGGQEPTECVRWGTGHTEDRGGSGQLDVEGAE